MIAKYCTGLQHIGIPTDDPAGTEAFYEKLGFVTVYRTATASGPVIFTELAIYSWKSTSSSRPGRRARSITLQLT